MHLKTLHIFFILVFTPMVGQTKDTAVAVAYNEIVVTGQLNKGEAALIQLAKEGNLAAQVVLAGALIEGLKMERNVVLAARIYQNVINNQSSKNYQDSYYIEACFKLAEILERGKEIPQDFVNSAILYKRAASQGHGESIQKLANLFREGKGVPQDDHMYLILMRMQLALAKLKVVKLKNELNKN